MTGDSTRYVFVYGTLRQGELRDINSLRPKPVWVGNSSLQGILYDLGTYPGLLLSQGARSTQVRGEVYAVEPDLERLLDEIEEVWPQRTGEYVKYELTLELDEAPALGRFAIAGPLNCFLYLIAPDRVLGKPVISAGDWVAYRTSAG